MLCGLAALCAVLWIYAPALNSYLVADDFQWIQGGLRFEPAGLVDLSSRTHFYRPIVEMYFAAVQAAFACSARALHAASVAVHLLNVALVTLVAWRLTGVAALAALAGLLFAVQPAPAEAVAWPSAISTLLCATFGLSMLAIDLGSDRQSPRRSAAVAVAYAAALGAHESAAVFLAAAVLLKYGRGERLRLTDWVRQYAACLAVLGGYLALTAWINSRNYVVTEGHYRLGAHAITNLFDYLVALYAGHRLLPEYALAAGVCGALMWKGSPRARALCAWMLIGFVPVLPFTWGTSSRYAYIPSIPFACLVAAGLIWLKDATASHLSRRGLAPALALVVLIVMSGFVAVRSALFARKGARAFAAGTSAYELAAGSVRRGATVGAVTIARSEVASIDPIYVLPLARTAVCDPAAVVEVENR